METAKLRPPSSKTLLYGINTLADEFTPKKLVFLDARGRWRENPTGLLQRTGNELIFQIWKSGQKQRALLFKAFVKDGPVDEIWPALKRIKYALSKELRWDPFLAGEELDDSLVRLYAAGGRAAGHIPALIILDVLGWFLHYEALRLISETFVPEWEHEAKIHKQEAAAEFVRCRNFLAEFRECNKDDPELAPRLETCETENREWLKRIPIHKAEEDRLLRILSLLLEKARASEDREEIYGIIADKIQPPQGIVTETSPALLRPCLKILEDENIPVSSGLPYKAAVILSILQDRRSTETLLHAMERIPSHFTKIRENLIYSLGSLREAAAADSIASILKEPDEAHFTDQDGKSYASLMLEQKEEALWALGKTGDPAVRILPLLAGYVNHSSSRLRTYLARALGEIGKAQKERRGGVSVEILITLLKLMQARHRHIFEEAVGSLRKIDMPHFIHTLYLYNAGAVSILGLQPAQKGLYELSETVHHLLQSKKRVIIAVNGDSGTGKTYFCQSLISGFGDLGEKDILYLMRDRKRDQSIFNRILGLKWLKKYVEPGFYANYPVPEKEDDPEAYLTQFLKDQGKKRLVILDGCRDLCYFQRVIEILYFRGDLDVEVNFRATLSTRRLNLEEREIALESVRTHLDFFEEPALEDTLLYQEGKAILYDLDNSIPSRLNRSEIQELFQKSRIRSWGDMIQIGGFAQAAGPLAVKHETLSVREEKISERLEEWPGSAKVSFLPEEKKFRAELNDDTASLPNLLQTIPADEIAPKKIQFYAQDQIAGTGEKGTVFVMTFPDSRIFYASAENNTGLQVSGRHIYLIHPDGGISIYSFEKNERTRITGMHSPALAIKAYSRDKIITGHTDGNIRIWDFGNRTIRALEGHTQPVISLAGDYRGNIYSGGLDRRIKQWDLAGNSVRTIESIDESVYLFGLYTREKMLAVSLNDFKDCAAAAKASSIRILDFQMGRCLSIPSVSDRAVTGINVTFDGRIIATLAPAQKESGKSGGLAVVTPGEEHAGFQILAGHSGETRDALVMGPRIITCGREDSGGYTLRVWGTEFYVKTAMRRLMLQGG